MSWVSIQSRISIVCSRSSIFNVPFFDACLAFRSSSMDAWGESLTTSSSFGNFHFDTSQPPAWNGRDLQITRIPHRLHFRLGQLFALKNRPRPSPTAMQPPGRSPDHSVTSPTSPPRRQSCISWEKDPLGRKIPLAIIIFSRSRPE